MLLLPVNDLIFRGCKEVIGVVVSSDSRGMFKGNHGSSLSGIFALFSRINPFSTFAVPSFLELQYHLGFICASNVMQNLANPKVGVTLLKPDLKKYSNTSFKQFKSILVFRH